MPLPPVTVAVKIDTPPVQIVELFASTDTEGSATTVMIKAADVSGKQYVAEQV